jgi:hypothetical protein
LNSIVFFIYRVKVKVVQEDSLVPSSSKQSTGPQTTELTASRLQLLSKVHNNNGSNSNDASSKFKQPADTLSKRTLSRTTMQIGSMSSIATNVGPNGFVPDLTLDMPQLSETMRLAPGVVLREGETVKRGPAPIRKVCAILFGSFMLFKPS